MQLKVKDTFSKELKADPITANHRRMVRDAFFSYVTARVPSHPSLIHVSDEMRKTLGLTEEEVQSEDFLAVFTGAKTYEGTQPYAMNYGGHQFGHWAGQLGDGRALNLMEVDANDQRWTLQLKGAGETPYSRSADGLAVLRSSIREHLCSEAMHHLGVPTTRSLSLALTGDDVLRDMLYDGNSAYEKGAVVCRVAPSFVRFGNFQIFAARQEHDNIRALADYVIKHFYTHIYPAGEDRYVELLDAVCKRTLNMVIHWQRVGFVHGVMNTDNMSILGLTIDYGPYGWLEGYDPDWTPNTTDKAQRRYRFGHQPNIALWNLYQLANALYPICENKEGLEKALAAFQEDFGKQYQQMMLAKLGIENMSLEVAQLIQALDENLQLTETDMTIFFRLLADFDENADNDAAWQLIYPAFYTPEAIAVADKEKWYTWLDEYRKAVSKQELSATDRKAAMNKVNPKYVLRNYMAQLAIDAADKGEYELIEELYTLLKRPYDEQPEYEKWFARRPDWARHKVGCSMLSCSS